MHLSDLMTVLWWWGLVTSFSLPGFFIGACLFAKFRDHGFVFWKTAGIIVVSFTVWFLGANHMSPFTKNLVIIIYSVFTAISLFSFFRFRDRLKINVRTVLFEEGLFLAGLIFWSFVRIHNPEIHGLEKFMDISLINASLKTTYFPPLDPWLAGHNVNYYYYGHFVIALLTKLSSQPSYITYNLSLGTIFGLVFSQAFSLVFNFLTVNSERVKLVSILAGLLAAFLITLGGNLHTVYVFTKGYPVNDSNDSVKPPWELFGGTSFDSYWYPSAVRMIPYTIHEIPSYSFVVSDLHAHLLDLPFVLTAFAIIFAFYLLVSNEKLTLKKMFFYFFLPINFAVLYMTNSLDTLSLIGLFFVIYLILTAQNVYLDKKKLPKLTFYFVLTVCSIFLLIYPFITHFQPFIDGIGINCAPFDLKLGPFIFDSTKCQHSPLYMLAVIWGCPFFILSTFSLWLALQKDKTANTDLFIMGTFLTSIFLVAFPEFFYFKDIYPIHFRANTMFKLGYTAFTLLTISSVYAIFRIKFSRSVLNVCFYILVAVQLFFVGIYPYFAIKSYYQNLSNYQSLDGSKFLEDASTSDYKAIEWLNANVDGQKNIVEAVGESYSDYARVSSFTGLPSVIGWPGHEWGWHKSGDEPYKRKDEVKDFYESRSNQEAKSFLTKYQIRYIFVGTLERSTYKIGHEEIFDLVGKKIFDLGETKIYQIL